MMSSGLLLISKFCMDRSTMLRTFFSISGSWMTVDRLRVSTVLKFS